MDREKTFTIEEAIEAFDRISRNWIGIEEEFDIKREELDQMNKDIALIEKAVIYENVFSENEEFEEVEDDHSK